MVDLSCDSCEPTLDAHLVKHFIFIDPNKTSSAHFAAIQLQTTSTRQAAACTQVHTYLRAACYFNGQHSTIWFKAAVMLARNIPYF
jgi:hypothetical protein